MKIKTPLFDIKIDIIFLIVMFIFFLYSKVRVFLSSFFICYLFIIFHEAAHMFVATLCGKEIETFNIGVFGVNINFKREHYNLENEYTFDKRGLVQNILIFIVGPISNLILALIFKDVKIIYDINMFLCILNLVPIYPLDGYNILKNLLLFKVNYSKTLNIINILNYILLFILFLYSIFILIKLYNPSLILFLIYLIILKISYRKNNNIAKYYN
mgnify:FL=1